MAISQAGGKATDEERETFSAHYWAVLGEFTQQAHCASLHEKRAALKKQLNILGRYEDKSLHDALVTFFATNFPKVFESDAFSPAARVNCLLVYSDLNSNEGEDIVATGAVPLAKALPTLIDVLKNKDGKFPAYLQPVALVGVTRHVFSSKGSLTSEQRKDLVQTLSGWLRDPQLKGVTPEVQNFVRRRAGEVLRVLAPKWPEANSADVAGALNQFAGDEDAPLDDRCEAARTLGVLDSKSFSEKTIPVIVRTLATLATEVGRQTAAPAEIEVAAADEPAEDAADGADANPDAAADEKIAKPAPREGKGRRGQAG